MTRIIDLTLDMEAGMPVPANLPAVSMKPLQRHADTRSGDARSVELYEISFPEHVGTHIDAPFHFAANGDTIEKMAIEPLALSFGRMLDFEGLPERAAIDADMIRKAENDSGLLRQGEAVFIHTGYWRHWGKPSYFAAPYLTEEAGALLLSREVSLLAIDCSTPDDTRGEARVIHDLFLKQHGIPILEGAAYLDRIPENPFRFIALPLKLRGASGSPVRLVALTGA